MHLLDLHVEHFSAGTKVDSYLRILSRVSKFCSSTQEQVVPSTSHFPYQISLHNNQSSSSLFAKNKHYQIPLLNSTIMAILLTGGTGKTDLCLASFLEQANIPFLLTSRRGPSASTLPTVQFDWNDESTWFHAFKHQFRGSEKITAVYLLSGELADPAPLLNRFMIWQKLHDEKLEYCVLRPSWFMGNFSTLIPQFPMPLPLRCRQTSADKKMMNRELFITWTRPFRDNQVSQQDLLCLCRWQDTLCQCKRHSSSCFPCPHRLDFSRL